MNAAGVSIENHYECIVTTKSIKNEYNGAPMGVDFSSSHIILSPFTSTTTYENIVNTKTAVINITDDANLYVACYRKKCTTHIEYRDDYKMPVIKNADGYAVVVLDRFEIKEKHDTIGSHRYAKMYCSLKEYELKQKRASLFSRANYALIETIILLSKNNSLSLDYFQNVIKKTGKSYLDIYSQLFEV